MRLAPIALIALLAACEPQTETTVYVGEPRVTGFVVTPR